MSEREALLSDEKLEARALAYREGADAMNAMAEMDCHSPVETEQFYSIGKDLWIKHTRLTNILKGRKDGQGT